MSRSWPIAFLGLLSLGGLSACAPDPAPSREQIDAPALHRHLEGSLEGWVKKIGVEPDEPCDLDQYEKKLALARDLDSRAEEIERLSSSGSTQLGGSNTHRMARLGPTFVREETGSLARTPGWKQDASSWTEVLSRHEILRDQPTDARWLGLNGAFRGNLTNDESRIRYQTNVYLGREAGPPLKSALESVSKCKADPLCRMPALEPELHQWLRSNPYYLWYMNRLQASPRIESARDLLAGFAERLEYDSFKFKFASNPKIAQAEAGTFVLPLDPGPFQGVETELARRIEEIWSAQGYRLQIRWVESMPEVFRILLESASGGRSFVNYSTREMHLFRNVRVRSIAHEVGHVLGFRDRYYTTWNPKTCEYVDEYNEEDLMSDSWAGTVQPDEWTELENEYPLSR